MMKKVHSCVLKIPFYQVFVKGSQLLILYYLKELIGKSRIEKC